MRVLVTGGGGFIGGWILRRLHDAGHSPVVFDMHDNRARVAEIAGAAIAESLGCGVPGVRAGDPSGGSADTCLQG
jgi:nucleoside-diphosphate-sugar epimerase